MKIEDFKKKILADYGIFIKEDCEYNGFIKKNSHYTAEIPVFENGAKFGDVPTKENIYLTAHYSRDIQKKVFVWLKMHPEHAAMLAAWVSEN